MAEQPASPEEHNTRMAMKAIRTEIKRLLDQWDPLCMRGLSGFVNQYSEQVGPIAVLLKKGAPPMEIARHLDRLVVEEWKLPPCREKCLELAEKMHRVGTMFHVSPAS